MEHRKKSSGRALLFWVWSRAWCATETSILLCQTEKKIGHWQKTRPNFLLLRRVRDEAHRFAISFHRQSRAKTEFASALDEIEGIGAARKKSLLHYFGSVKQIADARASDIARAPGISPAMAQKIYAHFH